MCRTGGRRCPGCNGATARAKHNERRRKNRAIKAAALAWARANGHEETAGRLEHLPPIEAKRFIAVHQLGEAQLGISLGPVSGHRGGGPAAAPPPPAPAGTAGAAFIARHGLESDVAALAQVAGEAKARRLVDRLQQLEPKMFGRMPSVIARGARKQMVRAAVGRFQNPRPPAPPPPPGPDWRDDARLLQQITTAQGSQGRLPVERLLLDSEPTSSTPVGGGTNTTVRVRLGAGQYAYHKPFDGLHDSLPAGFGQDSSQQPVHEVAAWRLAERLGPPWEDLVAPCVLREVDGKLGSLSMERAGDQLIRHQGKSLRDAPDAAFFDALIGQQDRHVMNALYDSSQNRVTLIDHGYAFSRPGDYINYSNFQNERAGSGAAALTSAERGKLRELLDSPDTFGLAGLLQPDRLAALRQRAEHMLATGRVMHAGTA